MDQPVVAQKSPYKVEMKAGESYFWCSCGLSTTQPFCDGSHKPTSFRPVRYQAEEDKTAWLCGCKASADKPFCDGAHKNV